MEVANFVLHSFNQSGTELRGAIEVSDEQHVTDAGAAGVG